jgi:hypothetical protein
MNVIARPLRECVDARRQFVVNELVGAWQDSAAARRRLSLLDVCRLLQPAESDHHNHMGV